MRSERAAPTRGGLSAGGWLGLGLMLFALVGALALAGGVLAPLTTGFSHRTEAAAPPASATSPDTAPYTAEQARARLDVLREEIALEQARLAALRAIRSRLQAELPAAEEAAEAALTDPPEEAVGEPPPAPPQPAPEPPRRGPRVFIHHRASSAAGLASATDLAGALRRAGMTVAGVRATPNVPTTPVVRFFHTADRAEAARLASRLGRGWAVQDFRAFPSLPARGTLEIWLPAG
ncbi:hypothetical protein [Roseomonas sp. AR75]|uniref:hypothetical protein n=1 Tax=Roseomonas sp. AR75 TaxID=2562311 RepID=UPI0010BF844A|nr:hypothetical protein [Roseomonas sp. AR75]